MHLCLQRPACPWRSHLIFRSLHFPSPCFLFSLTLTVSDWVWAPCLSLSFTTLQCYGHVNKSNVMWKHRTVLYCATCGTELIIHQKSGSCGSRGEFTAQKHGLSAETFPSCSSLGAECGYVWISVVGNVISAEHKTKWSLPFSWKVDNPRSWTWLHLWTWLFSWRWAEDACFSTITTVSRKVFTKVSIIQDHFNFLPVPLSTSFKVTWLDFCGTSCVPKVAWELKKPR